MKVYRLFENKDKYINRNSNLTDDQKEEIKNTLKKYSYLEGNVDWNKSDTFKYEVVDNFDFVIEEKGNTSINTTLPVQLSSTSGIRNNADITTVGNKVRLYGSLETYFTIVSPTALPQFTHTSFSRCL